MRPAYNPPDSSQPRILHQQDHCHMTVAQTSKTFHTLFTKVAWKNDSHLDFRCKLLSLLCYESCQFIQVVTQLRSSRCNTLLNSSSSLKHKQQQQQQQQDAEDEIKWCHAMRLTASGQMKQSFLLEKQQTHPPKQR